jgi:hypothetical protein
VEDGNESEHFSLPEDGFVSLRVYDVLGREVVVLESEQKRVGS